MCEDIESDIQVREPVIERLDDMDTGKDDPTLQHRLPLTFPSTRRLPISCLQLWVNEVIVTCVVIPSDCNPTEDVKIKHLHILDHNDRVMAWHTRSSLLEMRIEQTRCSRSYGTQT
jgi:hypothetical protein